MPMLATPTFGSGASGGSTAAEAIAGGAPGDASAVALALAGLAGGALEAAGGAATEVAGGPETLATGACDAGPSAGLVAAFVEHAASARSAAMAGERGISGRRTLPAADVKCKRERRRREPAKELA
jgi:hypothetical protein